MNRSTQAAEIVIQHRTAAGKYGEMALPPAFTELERLNIQVRRKVVGAQTTRRPTFQDLPPSVIGLSLGVRCVHAMVISLHTGSRELKAKSRIGLGHYVHGRILLIEG